ncbi:MAG: hypothetical protein M1817_002632 [Caeruleum heppii]|nr:MAG: hypothetical protein M1817_002632 [Caeruleum heppii]
MASPVPDSSALEQKPLSAPSSEKMADLDINGRTFAHHEQVSENHPATSETLTTEPPLAPSATPAANQPQIPSLNGTGPSEPLHNGITAPSTDHVGAPITSSGTTLDIVGGPPSQDLPPDSFESVTTLDAATAPAIVETKTSDLRQAIDPVTLEKAEEILEVKEQHLGLELEQPSDLGNVAIPSVEEATPVLAAVTDTPVEMAEAINAAEVGALQTSPPTVVEPPTAETPVDPAPTPITGVKAEQVPLDQVMEDAPASPSKTARAREDDEQEDGPSAKRTRVGGDDTATPEFKVPELPKLTTSTTPGEAVTAGAAEAGELKSMTKPQAKHMLAGIRKAKRSKDGAAFTLPVDPVKLGIPNYPNVIKNPMDLGTMEEKFKNEKYTTVDEVVADFNLIVNNSLTFNGAEHVVSKAAVSLKSTFDRHLSELPKPDVVEPTPAEKKAKNGAAGAAPRVSAARRESRSSTGVAGSPIAQAGSPTTTFALGPSGTPLIRRDSTVGDGRPKREIHPPPPRDLPYSTTKPKKKKYQWELKFCQEVLTELNKAKYGPVAQPFYNPVDPVALNIPHYHRIVKKPIDMGTIGSKLKNGQYENAKEFEVDMRLMFQNCYKFNPEGDPINAMGKQLEGVFNDKWASKREWIESHAPASTPQTPATSPEPESDVEESEEEEEEEEADPNINFLEKQLEHIRSQIDLVKKQKKKASPGAGHKKATKKNKPGKKAHKKGAAAAPSTSGTTSKPTKKKKTASKKERIPYITYEQKQEISNRINTLPANRMATALKIIRDNMPNLKVSKHIQDLDGRGDVDFLQGLQDEELELDIDELSDEVLYKLYQFVQKYAPGARQEDEPKPSRPKSTAAAGAAVGAKPRKNKPMSSFEQDAMINEIQGKLKKYQNGGSDDSPEPAQQDDDDSSDDDDDESGSESEEE